jgi:hypothetical protein
MSTLHRTRFDERTVIVSIDDFIEEAMRHGAAGVDDKAMREVIKLGESLSKVGWVVKEESKGDILLEERGGVRQKTGKVYKKGYTPYGIGIKKAQ